MDKHSGRNEHTNKHPILIFDTAMTKHRDDIDIFIHETLKGHVTERDLIGDYGGFKFDRQDCVDKIFFRVKAPQYLLEAGIEKNQAYVTRNNDILSFPLKQRFVTNTIKMGNGSFQDIIEPVEAEFIIGWTPEKLRIACEEVVYYIELSSEQDLKNKRRALFPTISTDPLAKKDMRALEQVEETRPTHAPNALVGWVRDRLGYGAEYKSKGDLYKEATSLFQSIADKIDSARCYSAFWDENGNKKRPKKEPKITQILHSYLLDGARIKNLDVIYQHLEAGGLDFRITGSLVSGEKINICIECKRAHSDDVIDGLVVQLPSYMHQRESDFGIFCILWFKGPYFSEPSEYEELGAFADYLNSIANSKGLDDIRVLPLDLAFPPPPSKLSYTRDQKPSWMTEDNKFLAYYFNKMPSEWLYVTNVEKEWLARKNRSKTARTRNTK